MAKGEKEKRPGQHKKGENGVTGKGGNKQGEITSNF